MAIGVSSFPILSFDQANPVLSGIKAGQGIMSTSLDQQKQALANALTQIQLQYSPKMTQAELAIKQATPNEINANARYLGSQTGINNYKLNNPALLYGDTPSLIDYMKKNGMVGGGSPTNSDSPINSGMPTGQIPNQGNMQNVQGLSNGVPTNSTQGQNTDSINQQAPDSSNLMSIPQYTKDPNVNSIIQQKLDPAGYAARIQLQTQNIKQSLDQQKDASEAANNAIDMNNSINQLKGAYNNLGWYEKGPVLGGITPISNAAQRADQAQQQINTNLTRALQSGHITNTDFAIGQKLGLSRKFSPNAFKDISDYATAMQQRITEKAPFFYSASKMGIDPQMTNLLYSRYMQERPAYDSSTQKMIPGNLGSYQDYLSPQAINSVQMGKPFKPVTSVADAKKYAQSVSLPNFNNKSDFQSWYQQLPKSQRELVKLKLGQ